MCLIGKFYFLLVLGKHFKEKILKLKKVRQLSQWRRSPCLMRPEMAWAGLRPQAQGGPSPPQPGHRTFTIQRIQKAAPEGVWRIF